MNVLLYIATLFGGHVDVKLVEMPSIEVCEKAREQFPRGPTRLNPEYLTIIMYQTKCIKR